MSRPLLRAGKIGDLDKTKENGQRRGEGITAARQARRQEKRGLATRAVEPQSQESASCTPVTHTHRATGVWLQFCGTMMPRRNKKERLVGWRVREGQRGREGAEASMSVQE